ncbi:MAG: hypothetical protein A2Z28_02040 [Chloroflexi bacterium RBG_16_51_9]|nr:MAG: hypothetical protein A2Z28_02040 [Chloroflexi bacterium RBG_16_51_9]
MSKVFRWVLISIAAVVLVGAAAIWWNFRAGRVSVPPPPPSPSAVTQLPETSENVSAPSSTTPPATPPPVTPPSTKVEPIVTLARNLEIPWGLDFLPDGSFGGVNTERSERAQDKSIIFTERPGRIRLIDSNGALLTEPLLTVTDVAPRGEGGLLGIAVHPDFRENGFIYVYHTYQAQTGLANRVVRYRLEGKNLLLNQVILDGIPASNIHDGGRLKFGPDGMLYITAGDASQPNLAQDKNSLAGKILRVKDDGSIPPDNPFPGSPVYSYGHRNPQGLAWDDRGRLWETEHGSSTRDELNLIVPGNNYGWPVIRGDETADGMVNPVLHSGDDTWAPSGLAFLPSASSGQANGSLYFAGLRGLALYQAVIIGDKVELKTHLAKKFGRLREVVLGPDNLLYLFTNNRDGRGVPADGDDLLLRVDPSQLEGR